MCKYIANEAKLEEIITIRTKEKKEKFMGENVGKLHWQSASVVLDWNRNNFRLFAFHLWIISRQKVNGSH